MNKQPMQVQCGKCDHEWIAAWTPMEMGKMAKLLKGLRCPMCAATSKNIFLPEKHP